MSLIWCWLFSFVLANTEKILFRLDDIESSEVSQIRLFPLVPYVSSFNFTEKETDEIAYTLTGLPTGGYLARVCWPATHPADLHLSFDKNTSTLFVHGSVGNIVLYNPGRMSRRQVVPFQVHLSPLKLFIIPEDVLPMIYSIIAVFIVGCLVAYVFATYIL